VDKLTAGDRVRCQLIAALRAAVDDALAKVTSANASDLGKLITAVKQLTGVLGRGEARRCRAPERT
jgi:hypothetical protein